MVLTKKSLVVLVCLAESGFVVLTYCYCTTLRDIPFLINANILMMAILNFSILSKLLKGDSSTPIWIFIMVVSNMNIQTKELH